MNFLKRLHHKISDQKTKGGAELKYWTELYQKNQRLSNDHFLRFYTEFFDLTPEWFTGKRVIDIGCGPRGSLEWATMAAERVGLDPLADSYGELGASAHEMSYVNADAEDIPFDDGYFDVVCTFNSLDHVNDLHQTIAELIRILKPGGLLLLLSDLNHDPTPCEPITFSWDVVEFFQPALTLLSESHYEKSEAGLYQSLTANVAYDHNNGSKRYGAIKAKFQKV